MAPGGFFLLLLETLFSLFHINNSRPSQSYLLWCLCSFKDGRKPLIFSVNSAHNFFTTDPHLSFHPRLLLLIFSLSLSLPLLSLSQLSSLFFYLSLLRTHTHTQTHTHTPLYRSSFPLSEAIGEPVELDDPGIQTGKLHNVESGECDGHATWAAAELQMATNTEHLKGREREREEGKERDMERDGQIERWEVWC